MWIKPQRPTPTPERLMGHRLNQQTSSRERAVQGTPKELWPGFLQRDLYPLTPPKQLSQYHHILKKDKQPSDGENERGRKVKGKKKRKKKSLLARMEITRPTGNERRRFFYLFHDWASCSLFQKNTMESQLGSLSRSVHKTQ